MIRRAGAFTKLIEIPAARAVAKGVMVPARNFMDGANGGELVLDDIRARIPGVDVVPADVAEMQPLSGYDVGEVPFIMQAVCCLLYTSPSPRDGLLSRMPSSA